MSETQGGRGAAAFVHEVTEVASKAETALERFSDSILFSIC